MPVTDDQPPARPDAAGPADPLGRPRAERAAPRWRVWVLVVVGLAWAGVAVFSSRDRGLATALAVVAFLLAAVDATRRRP